jgi:hypothetical protein
MRRIAFLFGAIGFLGLAAIGLASGVPTFTCAWRALLGAVVLFVLTLTAGRYLLAVLVDAWFRDGRRSNSVKDPTRGHEN